MTQIKRLFVIKLYKSFPSIKMTTKRNAVILIERKDLYISSTVDMMIELL